jgi:tetratricopeptide (TPR) repeat protein
MFSIRLLDFQEALVLARQLESSARAAADPAALGTADSVLSAILVGSGNLAGALIHAQQAYNQNTPAIQRAQIIRYGMAYSYVQARTMLAQTQWLQGMLDQSAQTIGGVLADTADGDHPVSLSFALTWSLVTLSYGQLETAESWITWLKDHAGKHAMSSYYACALGFDGMLHTQRGNFGAGEQLLRDCLSGLRQAQYEVLYNRFLMGLAEALLAANRIDESLAAIDEALDIVDIPLWALRPEALRIKGEILQLSNRAAPKIVEDHFLRSLDLAHRQGALFWQLRTAMSLGRLYHAQGSVHEARHQLQSVYARFTEGFNTVELQSAKRLLKEWSVGDACNGNP